MTYQGPININIVNHRLSYRTVCTQSNTIDCTTINICSWNNCCTRKSHTTICKGHEICIRGMTYQSPININIVNHRPSYRTVCTQSNTIDCTTINICSWNNCCTCKSHATICKGHEIRIRSMTYQSPINVDIINHSLGDCTVCS